MGPSIFLPGEEGEAGIIGPPGLIGPVGPMGLTGPMGPIVFLPGEDGEVGPMGPPGPAGAAGGGGGAPTDAEYWVNAEHASLSAEKLHQVVRKTSDQNITGGGPTWTDITDLGFTVVASGIYLFDWGLFYETSATTVGQNFAANGPAIGAGSIHGHSMIFSTSNGLDTRDGTAYDWGVASASGPGANLRMASVTLLLVNGANAGTVIARGIQETAAGTLTVRAGSWGRMWKLA